MEIFVFLYMGGSLDRIDVRPIGTSTRREALERFQSFDAESAKCFKAEERDRLLGVIEAG